MAKQSKYDRMDESLGMRRGKESMKAQTYSARRDESMGMKESRMDSKMFNVKDNQQAWEVRKINTNSEQYDLDRIKPYSNGSKGYPEEAWNYKY